MALTPAFELFFDLPSELREQTLGYLLVKSQAIQITHDSGKIGIHSFSIEQQNESSGCDEDKVDVDVYEADGPRWPLNYFLVSQTFNREATATYFRKNTFHIFSKDSKMLYTHPGHLRSHCSQLLALSCRGPRSGDALLLNPAWTPSVRRIRNIVVHVQRLRGFLDQSVCQPLLDMILAGGLKNLEFRMAFRSRGEAMFSALPMRCIYRVLTDPDLLVARLRIPAQNHESAWCPFHENGGDGCESCAISTDRLKGPGNGWLDVDVAALIRKYGEIDDQVRILKVGD